MANKEILKLFPAQQEIDESDKRFKVISAGRRFGKTKYALSWQIRLAWKTRGEEHWFVARTYKQAKDIAWKDLIKMVPPSIIDHMDRRELVLTLTNGSSICLKGSENNDSLRGSRIASLVMDEAAFQNPNIWTEILRPMTADLKAPVLFISSPRVGWFTRMLDDALSGKLKGWAGFRYTIYDNPYIDREEIEQIRAQTPERVFETEYLAIASTEDGQVYPEFTESCIAKHEHFPNFMEWRAVLGLDYGLADNSAGAWMHVLKYVYMDKEHVKSGWDVSRHAEVIKRFSHGRRILRGDDVLDRSAFRREATSMTSIADQFRKEGVYCVRSEKAHQAGVDIVKRFLRGDGRTPWLYINPSCRETIRAFSEWEHGQHEPDILAALRYALTHIVKKRLTVISHNITSLKSADEEPIHTGPRFGQTKKKNSRWGWDDDYGVPR